MNALMLATLASSSPPGGVRPMLSRVKPLAPATARELARHQELNTSGGPHLLAVIRNASIAAYQDVMAIVWLTTKSVVPTTSATPAPIARPISTLLGCFSTTWAVARSPAINVKRTWSVERSS